MKHRFPAGFQDYPSLVRAIVARRRDLGLSQLEVDDLAGLPDGYTGKIEMSLKVPHAKNARALGKDSLPLLLGALKLWLVAVPQDKLPKSRPLSMAARGRLGAKAKAESTTPERRAEIARNAAAARWRASKEVA